MHLHIDCQFGMAGDMLLAALIDAGADREDIEKRLMDIPLPDFNLKAARTTRSGVTAVLVDVADLSGAVATGSHTHDHSHDDHDHEHKHDHAHGESHGHDHPHPEEAPEDPGRREHSHAGPHRHLGDLLALLQADVVPNRVRERAEQVFRIMAEAEATVHGQPVAKVHFHEISGIDTAVDVIGSCFALEMLGIDTISASPPSVGSGMIMCEHGIFPVPAPATLEILKSHNIPWRPGGEGERSTPTGMALLAGLAQSFGDSPAITVTRIGYGAGHREYADVPNLLRAIVGKPGQSRQTSQRTTETSTAFVREPGHDIVPVSDRGMLPVEIEALLPASSAQSGDRVIEFRLVVDDMTPEAIGHLLDRCLAAGAVEAYTVQAVMKKSRPGHEITVLSPPELAAVVADAIWRDSTTFGMRVGERTRMTLARDFRTVMILGHSVRIKLGWRDGKIIRRQPEFEDCRALSLAAGKSLEEIFELAREAALGAE